MSPIRRGEGRKRKERFVVPLSELSLSAQTQALIDNIGMDPNTVQNAVKKMIVTQRGCCTTSECCEPVGIFHNKTIGCPHVHRNNSLLDPLGLGVVPIHLTALVSFPE